MDSTACDCGTEGIETNENRHYLCTIRSLAPSVRLHPAVLAFPSDSRDTIGISRSETCMAEPILDTLNVLAFYDCLSGHYRGVESTNLNQNHVISIFEI